MPVSFYRPKTFANLKIPATHYKEMNSLNRLRDVMLELHAMSDVVYDVFVRPTPVYYT